MLEKEIKQVLQDLKSQKIESFIFDIKDIKKIHRQCLKLKVNYSSLILPDNDSIGVVYLSTIPKFLISNSERPALRIISDYKSKELFSWYDLSEKERIELDLDDKTEEELDDYYINNLFKVKNQIYCLNNFMRIDHDKNSVTQFWDGVEGTSYFCYNLVKYTDGGDGVIFARAYSL